MNITGQYSLRPGIASNGKIKTALGSTIGAFYSEVAEVSSWVKLSMADSEDMQTYFLKFDASKSWTGETI